MKKQEILQIDRLKLRPFRLSDTTLNIPYPYSDGLAEEWISTHPKKFESGESIVYAITLKETDELVGAINLHIKKDNIAALGYWIAQEMWGNGYCTEAGKALVEYGFTKI